jgi:hypothetical protein
MSTRYPQESRLDTAGHEAVVERRRCRSVRTKGRGLTSSSGLGVGLEAERSA